MEWNDPRVLIAALGMLGALIYLVAKGLFRAGKWVEGVNAMKPAIERIEATLNRVNSTLNTLSLRFSSGLTEDNSPIALNDRGKAISNKLNVAQWAKNEAQQLMGQLEGKNPYEMQQFCYGYVEAASFEPTGISLSDMQETAYMNAITVDMLKEVFAIELRDALLAHTGQSSAA